jgi:Arc/MetJ-type ribon-helix-helix transcriptional regulator
MSFLYAVVDVRLSDECMQIIKRLMNKYPDLYATEADVLRAGLYALERWRNANHNQEIEDAET